MASMVQISLDDSRYADQLCRYLRADPTFADCRVLCGETEQGSRGGAEGVRVIDLAHLPPLSPPLANPAKTVLIVSGAVDLEQVGPAGIISVLHHGDPMEYIKVAILAALLRPSASCRLER